MTAKVEHRDGKKRCSRCQVWKTLDAFGVNNRQSDGLYSRCKECRRNRQNYLYNLTPDKREKQAEAMRKSRYGMAPGEHARMFKEQGGRCAICRQELVLVIDHCHTSKRVRGLLCKACNLGIGYFHDDLERLRAAIDYLARAGQ